MKKSIVKTPAAPMITAISVRNGPLQRLVRIVEVHDLDDTQVIERGDDAGDKPDHGERVPDPR